MAPSTATPSNEEKCSFPISLSAVNVSNFVSSKLWGDKQSNNYCSWKQQMLCLIMSHDLLCHITCPESTAAYAFPFQRTDMLLKGWILGALSDAVLKTVANSSCATAKDVWLELEKNFNESAGQTDTLTQKDLNEYLPLYKAILQGNWDAAKEILDDDPNALKARINSSKQTALHVAVATCKPYHFVEKLVALMLEDSSESIALKDDGGNTALSIAAAVGNKEAAILLVNKMDSLVYVPDSFGNFPVHQAAQFSNKDMLKYLIDKTRDDLDINPYDGIDGLRLLTYVIDAKFFDVAIELVEKYPHVAKLKLPDNTSALKKIAAKRSPFLSTHICEEAVELIKCLCKIMGSMRHEEVADIYVDAIMKATELGSSKVVEQMVEAFPDAIYCSTPSSKQSIFHIAVQNRSVDVFNILYQKKKSGHEHSYLDAIDSEGNNLLHAAAKLAPSHKLNELSRAALQMQREISWYKAIRRIVHPNCRDQPNKVGKTPQMVFAEEHKKLKEEAQKWTKDTANSCMVAAALIAGATFAGTITVPGGHDSSSGFPKFSEKPLFIIYGSSISMSFLAATLCLLLLLSMLISRYAAEDFLLSIPQRLVLSLVTLFISVAFMIISFFAAVFLLSDVRKGPFIRKSSLKTSPLMSLPVLLLFFLAFGPLRHYFTMTYGPIKSVKKTDRAS